MQGQHRVGLPASPPSRRWLGRQESALCLRKHVHPKEEATCGVENREEEDTAGVKEGAAGVKEDAVGEEEDVARGRSEKEDRGPEEETPGVPEGICAATKEGETHGDEGFLRSTMTPGPRAIPGKKGNPGTIKRQDQQRRKLEGGGEKEKRQEEKF
ncbi:hypothetical protein NDU88_000598 [Pleurodeles waltl]|uniref:Uncharacterized protein n=1 Tax=Pleurodeles waltl TaxID=8319 RepID=A0AAV7V9E0_PLEWA|nr:hypothetical protein NDU88_000598 [Pleurodeles waltl]